MFKPEVTLKQRAQAFSIPTAQWVARQYPNIAEFPVAYMSALVLGIWLSGTEPIEQIENLAAEIEQEAAIVGLFDSVTFWTRRTS